MGPLSDQALLQDVADATSGTYLYMPTIDDLFLIFNVIREQVTGDGLVVNERHTASASRVGAWIEEPATEATFLVNWFDTALNWSPRDPKKRNEIQVRLRMPNGKLLHPFDPSVRRFDGTGYVAFRVEEPLPGQWWVEVRMASDAHTAYAVGGFVKSPIRLDVRLSPQRPLRGTPLDVRANVWHGRGVVDLTGNVCVTAPTSSPQKLVTDFRRRLGALKAVTSIRRDTLPAAFREPIAIDLSLRKEGRVGIGHTTVCSPLKSPLSSGGGSGGGSGSGGGGTGLPGGGGSGGGGGIVFTQCGRVPPGGGGNPVLAGSAAADLTVLDDLTSFLFDRPIPIGTLSGAVAALRLFAPTMLQATYPGSSHTGSINATVNVQGTTLSGARFTRTTIRSVRVG
jgi:uncharacterized membrane protein YgcG